MKKPQYYIDILKRIAKDVSPVGNQRLAACLVKNNKIIAFGYNKNKTHPLQHKFRKNIHSIYLHAEIDAIKNALRELPTEALEGTTLYIARVKKDGTEGMAKPCGNHHKGCTFALETFGVSKVIYTTEIEHEYGTIN
jgi:deoxycytidylate deaminase